MAGRLECTCGDWIWRRASQTTLDLADCKHCKAIHEHFYPPVDLHEPQYTAADMEFDNP
jgi:hypothetical protein